MTRVALSALAVVAVVACADSSRPLGPGGARPQVSAMSGYTIVDIGTLGQLRLRSSHQRQRAGRG